MRIEPRDVLAGTAKQSFSPALALDVNVFCHNLPPEVHSRFLVEYGGQKYLAHSKKKSQTENPSLWRCFSGKVPPSFVLQGKAGGSCLCAPRSSRITQWFFQRCFSHSPLQKVWGTEVPFLKKMFRPTTTKSSTLFLLLHCESPATAAVR